MKRESPHWYFITAYVCPLCGKTEEIRERRSTPRPERHEQRHEIVDSACGSHFM